MSLVKIKPAHLLSDHSGRKDQRGFRLPITLVKPLIKLLVAEGVGLAQLLADTGIQLIDLTQPGVQIQFYQLDKLVNNAYRLAPKSDFALRLGEQLHFNQDGLLDLRIMSSDNVGQAMFLLNDYQPLLTPLLHLHFAVEEGKGIFSATPEYPLGNTLPFMIEYLFAATYSLGKFCLGVRNFPLSIELAYPEPPRSQLYQSFFSNPIRFGCDQNRAILPASVLAMPLIFADKSCAEKNDLLCQYKVKRAQSEHGIIHRVNQLLQQNELADMSLEALAEQLCMSPRTLRRQLQLQEVSYKSLLESQRKKTALKLIRRNELSMEVMAGHLGYKDTSSFSRAFKKWFGVPPNQFRDLGDATWQEKTLA